MVRVRSIEDEGDARRCLEEAKREGLSPLEWGKKYAVDGRSLRAWVRKLERPSSRRSPSRPRRSPSRALVELIPRTTPVVASSRYVLEVAGARVEFGDDITVATLRRIVEALRTC